MDIGIDLRVLAGGSYGGIAQYLLCLLPELFSAADRSAYGGKIKFKLFFNAYQKKLFDYPWLENENVQLIHLNYPNRLLFASSKLFEYPKLDNLIRGADVFFSPHFLAAPLSPQCRSVVTIHDLSFIHYPEFFSLRKNIWHRLEMNPKKQALRADKVIAVSESTKNDLVNLFGIDPEKIQVIYSGSKSEIHPLENSRAGSRGSRVGGISDLLRVKKKYNLPENFFLFLGTLEPRKNIPGILRAFAYLKSNRQIPDHTHLVIAGSQGWLYADILKIYRDSPYQKFIHFLGPIEEKEKPFLYLLSRVFVYPSFFEGFGFPPLEAMSAGVPVVTSKVSSLPEVVGDAGIMVDPYNIKEIAEAMKNLFLSEKLRHFYIEKGRKRAQEFSWRKSAEQTLQALVSVVDY